MTSAVLKRVPRCCTLIISCIEALTSLSQSVSDMTFYFRNGLLVINQYRIVPIISCRLSENRFSLPTKDQFLRANFGNIRHGTVQIASIRIHL